MYLVTNIALSLSNQSMNSRLKIKATDISFRAKALFHMFNCSSMLWFEYKAVFFCNKNIHNKTFYALCRLEKLTRHSQIDKNV